MVLDGMGYWLWAMGRTYCRNGVIPSRCSGQALSEAKFQSVMIGKL